MNHFGSTIALIGLVIVVGSLLSGMLEKRGVPLVAAFLALGAAVGPFGLGLVDVQLRSPALAALATLGLTVMLFSDAVTIDITEVRTHRGLALLILGPGTLLPAALITGAAALLLELPLAAAAVLGAALASTDPVLLRAALRGSSLPTVTRIALRLETGMNDALLLPIVALGILLMRHSGGPVPVSDLGRSLAGLLILGPVLGALVGWAGISVLAAVRSRSGVRRDYESLYALALALCGYAAAEAVGGSGFLAAFAAGLVVAAQDVELCDCFLEYGEATAEMLLLLTFVALGTSLIWSGLGVIDAGTLTFAGVALLARTAVLYPLTGRRAAGVTGRNRALIALLGPRGISSLLLVLLAVFAGVPHAERMFTVACLVVLMSIASHGAGIALLVRRAGAQPRERTGENADDRITIGAVLEMRARGEPFTAVDSRAARDWNAAPTAAEGAVRIPPDDPVTAAKRSALDLRGTLVVYCA